MLFTSHLFIFVFLPLTVAFCFLAEWLLGRAAALAIMIAASLVFYFSNSHAQIAVLLASIFLNALLNWAWFQTKSRPARIAITVLLIAGNLACLAYYKYATFLLGLIYPNTNITEHTVDTLHMAALPLGISFFTFQQIAYAADVYAGRVQRHRLLDYVFCVAFFPHLIAGPIVNYRELIPQLRLSKVFSFNGVDLAVGISVFVAGLAKKTLIADNFATFVGPAFNAADAGHAVDFWAAWAGTLAYTFQIYFDFSGYSDMAIGLARIFGIQLPANFASPYKAESIIDFWRRWHMTLSRFLRQYLYIPLGGSRRGPLARYRNIFITMLLGGLWHGAGVNFILWGGLHGLLIVINHIWRDLTGNWEPKGSGARRSWSLFCGALTFLSVLLAWVFFRATTLEGAETILTAMALPTLDFASFDPRFLSLAAAACIIVFLLPNTQEIFSRYAVSIRPEWAPRLERPMLSWRLTYPWMLTVAIIAGVASMYEAEFPQFLYWGF